MGENCLGYFLAQGCTVRCFICRNCYYRVGTCTSILGAESQLLKGRYPHYIQLTLPPDISVQCVQSIVVNILSVHIGYFDERLCTLCYLIIYQCTLLGLTHQYNVYYC